MQSSDSDPQLSAADVLTPLLARVKGLPPIRVAVVHPCDALSLSGAMDARAAGLIEPVLIGPAARIAAAANEAGISLDGVMRVDTPHSHAAAARAVELVAQGRVEALMKGSLHTDELMPPWWPAARACAPSGASATAT